MAYLHRIRAAAPVWTTATRNKIWHCIQESTFTLALSDRLFTVGEMIRIGAGICQQIDWR